MPLKLSELQIIQELNSFRVTFTARHQQHEIDCTWKAVIEATCSRCLTFSMEGQALSNFLRSHVGFCVLHCAEECVGNPFSVLRPDGTLVEGVFPQMITRELPITGTEAVIALSPSRASICRRSLLYPFLVDC